MELPDWYPTDFDPYCMEIGRLSALWASLERSIDHLIWELMDVPAPKGICVTAQMIGPGPRLRSLLSLVDSMGPSETLAKEFQRFGTKVIALGAKRNRFAHDTYSLALQTKKVQRHEFTADRVLRITNKEVNIDDIRKLWIESRAMSRWLHQLRLSLLAEQPAWKRTRYKQSLSRTPPDTPDQD